jgi:two-component system, NtrC family, response regulator PilR
MGRVLVVDDERGIREAVEALVEGLGHDATLASSLEEAEQALTRGFFDLVITDLKLSPHEDEGLEVVKAARNREPGPEIIVMTAFGSREKAQAAVAQGASFYLEKGPHLASDIRVLARQAITKRALQAENEQLRRALIGEGSAGIIGRSAEMREVLDLVERVAPLQVTTLVTGESGTGKERVARALHEASSVREGPFVPVNCGAVPEHLIESELFGHVKGAFTGAEFDKLGLFEAASGGTIFLDEVGELPFSLQPKLLRVLQEHRIKKVGAVDEQSVDVRVVAATNKDLEAEAEAGRFREDLFFRLNVVQIDLPPLRRRSEDLPLLAQHFLRKYARAFHRDVDSIEPEAMKRLLDFDFPGNVRQLENVIERGVALTRGTSIGVEQLPKEIRGVGSRPEPVRRVAHDAAFPDEGVDMERLVEDFEYGLIQKALEKADGVKTKAAELLGVSFRQFRYKLSKLDRSERRKS